MERCGFTGEYIQLNQLLKRENMAVSGADARRMIEEGLVKVNHRDVSEIRKKLRDGDLVEVRGMKTLQMERVDQ